METRCLSLLQGLPAKLTVDPLIEGWQATAEASHPRNHALFKVRARFQLLRDGRLAHKAVYGTCVATR